MGRASPVDEGVAEPAGSSTAIVTPSPSGPRTALDLPRVIVRLFVRCLFVRAASSCAAFSCSVPALRRMVRQATGRPIAAHGGDLAASPVLPAGQPGLHHQIAPSGGPHPDRRRRAGRDVTSPARVTARRPAPAVARVVPGPARQRTPSRRCPPHQRQVARAPASPERLPGAELSWCIRKCPAGTPTGHAGVQPEVAGVPGERSRVARPGTPTPAGRPRRSWRGQQHPASPSSWGVGCPITRWTCSCRPGPGTAPPRRNHPAGAVPTVTSVRSRCRPGTPAPRRLRPDGSPRAPVRPAAPAGRAR